jgi:hypothetical protein
LFQRTDNGFGLNGIDYPFGLTDPVPLKTLPEPLIFKSRSPME